MAACAARHGLELDVQQPINKPPVDFAGDLVDAIRAAVRHCGYSSMDILSGAGHDAMNIARVAPTAMIFVPCKDGLSHNEAESATARGSRGWSAHAAAHAAGGACQSRVMKRGPGCSGVALRWRSL